MNQNYDQNNQWDLFPKIKDQKFNLFFDIIQEESQSFPELPLLMERQSFDQISSNNIRFLKKFTSCISQIDSQQKLFQKPINIDTQCSNGSMQSNSDVIDHQNLKVENHQTISKQLDKSFSQSQIKEQLKFLFRQENLRSCWKKNTNVPKFIARIFMKHYQSFLQQGQKDLLEYHKTVCQYLNSKPSNNFSISDILMLLRDENDLTEYGRRINQRILSEIIQKTSKHEIMDNKYIQNHHKKSYLMAMKIYNIRCRSKTLTQRVKTL